MAPPKVSADAVVVGAVWVLAVVPAWAAMHAGLVTGMPTTLATSLRELNALPHMLEPFPVWVVLGMHAAVAVAGMAASLAWLGQQQALAVVGAPPKAEGAPAADSGLGFAGSFVARRWGKPVTTYCDGAEALDDADRLSLDPRRPSIIAGGSGDTLAGQPSVPAAYPSSCIADTYAAHGLGPAACDPSSLYLDLICRAVAGAIYQDASIASYSSDNVVHASSGFSLAHRSVGADCPHDALSLVGIRRLRSIQQCVLAAIDEGIPGDVLECGVLFGGAAIAAKAALRVRGADSGPAARRMLCADTFSPPPPADRVPMAERGLLTHALAWVGCRIARSIARFAPDAALATLTLWAQRAIPAEVQSFPPIEGIPDAATVRIVRAVLAQAGHSGIPGRDAIQAGLHRVRSHFARFGLLDDGVIFLRGFFDCALADDAFPGKGHPVLGRVAVLRLDGDTFESTRSALEAAYDRLSPGGFCIVDDYGSFPGCKVAVDAFRAARGIDAPLKPIDGHAVLWRRADREPLGRQPPAGPRPGTLRSE